MSPRGRSDLLDPAVRALAAALVAGRVGPAEWLATRRRHLVRAVAPFLAAGGDLKALQRLVRQDPWSLFHPVTVRQLVHLWKLARRGGRVVRGRARMTLGTLAAAWRDGLLDGLSGPAAPRGVAPWLARELEDVRERLAQYQAAPIPGESPEGWERRWVETLQVVWAETDLAGFLYAAGEPGSERREYRSAGEAPNEATLATWLGAARARSPAAFLDQLAARLVAFRWGLAPDRVRAAARGETSGARERRAVPRPPRT